MARKPTGNPTGCPKKEINWELFEQLCSLQCTQSEIASTMKIHPDTLRDHAVEKYGEDFSNIYKTYSENGKCSLRRYQFIQAKTKPNMAIWLGKQWLKQTDTFVSDTPQNDHILHQILANIKSPNFGEQILDLTKANQALQDQVNALQAQLQEPTNDRTNDAGLRTDAQIL